MPSRCPREGGGIPARRAPVPRACWPGSPASGRADVVGLRAPLPLAGLEVDPLPLVQRPVTALVGDRGEVDEHVRAAVVGGDEAEALLGVEPRDGALGPVAATTAGGRAAPVVPPVVPAQIGRASCRERV